MEIALPPALGLGQIVLRLLCAMAVGMVIGTEREYSNRPAGMRTHILVALGACSVMLTGELIFIQYRPYGSTPDPARLAAQVITGVGFLGAGTILREGPNVHGLTTAASLWAVACLGVAAGGGYYSVAVIGMIFIFITLTVFETLQNRLVGTQHGLVYYCLETPDVSAGLDTLTQNAQRYSVRVSDMKTYRLDSGSYRIVFQVDITGLHTHNRRKNFVEKLTSDPAVTSLHLFDHSDAAELQG